MENITVRTWNDKDSLTLTESTLILDWLGTTKTIPLSQVIGIELKEPKGTMRPGMITILIPGESGSALFLTPFFSTGSSNNIEFPHGIDYKDEAHRIRDYILRYIAAPPMPEKAENGADEIRKYKKLLDEGIITAEEFDAAKKKVLGL